MKHNVSLANKPIEEQSPELDELDSPFEFLSGLMDTTPPPPPTAAAKTRPKNGTPKTGASKTASQKEKTVGRDSTQDLLDMIEPCDFDEEESESSQGDGDTELSDELFASESSVTPPPLPAPSDTALEGVSAEEEPEEETLASRLHKITEVLDSSLLRFRLAVDNFMKTMREGDQEATCYLLIGCLFMKKGLITEAIGYFRSGLHVPGVTQKEAVALFFQMGRAYEKLENFSEAEYYYSKVHRMNPKYRSVAKRLQAVTMFSECTNNTQVEAEAIH